ncbi:hypothetical protein [Halorussus halophilus]|uniref:hypothetical protein n=1 Tax=Halorussus halophilus TaxID=2650975 RepID=UPI001300F24B|nr:hypothetical protein [Halorussus halophilus]
MTEKDRPSITVVRQATFTPEGDLETSDESVETSLEDFGASVDHHDREPRLDEPEAETFGIDDRPATHERATTDQATLFVDTDDDQRTLEGDRVAERCRFDS